jgi:lipopolysaccharide/colanic/teichoic acid biosynthesis glycosyltransferase
MPVAAETIRLPRRPVSLYQRVGKRCFETCLVLLVMPATLIALAGSGLLILLTDSRPVLYWQTRIGHRGRPFRMCKLRTMRPDAEAETGAVWAVPDDPRTTRCGRFLRRFHLDELPQLFQVLTGTMCLVGPRPERPELIAWLRKVLPDYDERLQVRPGITGWAQVHRGADACIEDVAAKLAYDREYVATCSFRRDLQILGRTLTRFIGRLAPPRASHETAPTVPLPSGDAP